MVIWRGTTPTLQLVVKTVDPSTITDSRLSFYTAQETVVEKDLSTAEVSSDSISWTLTQEETLAIQSPGRMTLYAICNWLTSNGTRGVSNSDTVVFKNNPVNEVMT